MIVAIHQPHFLPWLGYLHRMAQVDAFVLLDHVQFERRNYQNRTMIRVNDEARWLTVPVIQHSQKERIVDKQVDNRIGGPKWWSAAHFATLRHAYGASGFFAAYAAQFKQLFEARFDKLVDVNLAGLELLRERFGINTPLVKSSELAVEGARGDLILNICRALRADALMVGFGGSRGYLDTDAFARAGVSIVQHQFKHPEYPQCATKGTEAAPFLRGLSAIDLLFNCGPRSRDLLLADRTLAQAA
ncbi:MAG TPA: WbqC family protein [Burkholderiaceae bacterium]|nr:WbqC family protein [Burkholderiaceae bacterium]